MIDFRGQQHVLNFQICWCQMWRSDGLTKEPWLFAGEIIITNHVYEIWMNTAIWSLNRIAEISCSYSHWRHKWGFPQMVLPQVIIIPIFMWFSLTKTIQLLGHPHDYGNSDLDIPKFRYRPFPCGLGCTTPMTYDLWTAINDIWFPWGLS